MQGQAGWGPGHSHLVGGDAAHNSGLKVLFNLSHSVILWHSAFEGIQVYLQYPLFSYSINSNKKEFKLITRQSPEWHSYLRKCFHCSFSHLLNDRKQWGTLPQYLVCSFFLKLQNVFYVLQKALKVLTMLWPFVLSAPCMLIVTETLPLEVQICNMPQVCSYHRVQKWRGCTVGSAYLAKSHSLKKVNLDLQQVQGEYCSSSSSN